MIKFSDAKMKEIPKLLKSMSDALKVLNSDFEALKKIMDESKEPYVAREPKKRRSLPHTKDPNDISKRSYKRITVADLRRLVKIAHEDREDFFAKHPRWRKLYSDRVICIALCQGAALHYLYGKTGVKDFDVWTLYSEHPSAPFPYRRMGGRDFGSPKFGRHPSNADKFMGRGVDLIGRSLKCSLKSDPVKIVQEYLSNPRTASAKALSKKAVVLLYPDNLFGKAIWPI